VRTAARDAGRALDDFAVTVWPASFRHGASFDIGLARAFRDAGADRLIIAAHEAGDAAPGAVRRFVAGYRDRIASAL
jgi:hypothetical protein